MPADRLQPSDLDVPIVQAPLAGGPSTPALAVAVAQAGGLGSLAAGYKTAGRRGDPRSPSCARPPTGRSASTCSSPPASRGRPGRGRRATSTAARRAERYGAARRAAPRRRRVRREARRRSRRRGAAVVSFTFGCPAPAVVDALQEAGCAVWVTVTTPAEAGDRRRGGRRRAASSRASRPAGTAAPSTTPRRADIGLLALLQLVGAAVRPADGRHRRDHDRPRRRRGAGGGRAAPRSSAPRFMLAPEAATGAPHRAALAAGDAPTGLTRAFTGRTARGIVNRFMREHAAMRRAPTRRSTTSRRRCARPRASAATPRPSTSGRAGLPARAELPAAELVARAGGRRAGPPARARLGRDLVAGRPAHPVDLIVPRTPGPGGLRRRTIANARRTGPAPPGCRNRPGRAIAVSRLARFTGRPYQSPARFRAGPNAIPARSWGNPVPRRRRPQRAAARLDERIDLRRDEHHRVADRLDHPHRQLHDVGGGAPGARPRRRARPGGTSSPSA